MVTFIGQTVRLSDRGLDAGTSHSKRAYPGLGWFLAWALSKLGRVRYSASGFGLCRGSVAAHSMALRNGKTRLGVSTGGNAIVGRLAKIPKE